MEFSERVEKISVLWVLKILEVTTEARMYSMKLASKQKWEGHESDNVCIAEMETQRNSKEFFKLL